MPLRKVSRVQQEFVAIIYEVADKLNLNDIDFITEFGSDEIDSFLHGIFKVQINGFTDGQKIKQTVVIKWHPELKERMCYRKSYQREFVFYQHVVPALLDIQRRFKVIEGLKIKFPNCIYASAEHNKETIVVLSLRETRFRFLDRFHNIDLDHASLVVQCLAKLHALSFALEKCNPTEFNYIKQQCSKDVQYSDPSEVSRSMENYYNTSVNVVSDPVAKEKLQALAPSILNILNKCTLPGPHSAICHGDCWHSNISFKYIQSKSNRPVDVLLIDYQLSRLASPATDISYFLYMSAGKDFLSQHHNRLLDIYYGTLSAVLRQCDLDVKEIYPWSVFQSNLRKYSVFGLIEALVSLKIVTAAGEEAFKLTERQYSSENGFIETESQNQSLYVERVNGIVNDFFEKDYSLHEVLNE